MRYRRSWAALAIATASLPPFVQAASKNFAPDVVFSRRNPKAPGGAEFVPELIHNRSGVGSHLTAVDLNRDGRPEIITSTKRGTFIFWNNWNAAGKRPERKPSPSDPLAGSARLESSGPSRAAGRSRDYPAFVARRIGGHLRNERSCQSCRS